MSDQKNSVAGKIPSLDKSVSISLKLNKILLWAAGVLLVICLGWLGMFGYWHHTQAKYQVPGQIYSVKLSKSSKMYKQMQSLDQDGSLTKPSYFVFGKDNHAVASATSKKQALKLQKSDQKIKKASNGLTYSAGKNSVDFNVKTPEASMDHIFSAKDLKFHQGSGNEVKGKYGMSFFGMTMKIKTSDLVVNHVK